MSTMLFSRFVSSQNLKKMAEEKTQTTLVFIIVGILFILVFLLGKVIHRFKLTMLSESGVAMFFGL